MNKLLLLLMLAVALLAPAAQAQSNQQEAPVKWISAVRMTGNDSGVLSITATPSAGWHLYGTTLPEGGPKPTVIDLSGSAGIIFEGNPSPSAKPTGINDPLFGMQLNWWAKPVTFTVKFKIADGRASGRIKAKITYMACNDHNCVPPVTETLFRNVTRK